MPTMPKHTRPVPEPEAYPGPPSSGLILHPRLRTDHRIGNGQTIRVKIASARVNPRRLDFTVSGRNLDRYREFEAVQQYGTTFVDITEIDQFYRPLFFDAENEPEITAYIHKAFDVQWPMGPLGVARRPVNA